MDVEINTDFQNNVFKIASELEKLIKVEVKNVASNKSEVIKCGLWLTRLCNVANQYNSHTDADPITDTKEDYTKYKGFLSEILLTEIHDEYRLASKGKYNWRLLHYITKGIKIANATWFQK